MKTLLTGATGFVGAALLRRLVAAGHDVRVFARHNGDRRNLSGIDCEIAVGDLTDPESIRRAVSGCDAVFHAAADYRLWVPDPEHMNRVNVQGTVDLIRAAAEAGAKRIVYTSSVATLRLGHDGLPADEQAETELSDMIGAYKRSKFLAECEVMRLVAEERCPVVIVKPSAPFGPRDVKPTPTGRLVVEAASGRMPAYVDTGLNVVHVDDVAGGHLLAFDKGVVGESYILGGENLKLRRILEIIAGLTGRPAPRIRLPHWFITPVAHVVEGFARLTNGGEPMITVDSARMARKLMYFSSEKAERALGYRPRPAIDALRDAIEWFRANGYLAEGKKQDSI